MSSINSNTNLTYINIREISEDHKLYIPKNTNEITSTIVNNLLKNANKTEEDILEIVFNDDLETIGKKAFEHFTVLVRVVIPDSVKIISDSAFVNCKNIEFISFGNGVRKIESNAFYRMGEGKQFDNYRPQIILGEHIQFIHHTCFFHLKHIDLLAIPYNRSFSIHGNNLSRKGIRGTLTQYGNMSFWKLETIERVICPKDFDIKNISKYDIFYTHSIVLKRIYHTNTLLKTIQLDGHNFTNFIFPDVIFDTKSIIKNTIFKDADMSRIKIVSPDGRTDRIEDYKKVFKYVDFTTYRPKKYPRVLQQYYEKLLPYGMSRKRQVSSNVAKMITGFMDNNNRDKMINVFKGSESFNTSSILPPISMLHSEKPKTRKTNTDNINTKTRKNKNKNIQNKNKNKNIQNKNTNNKSKTKYPTGKSIKIKRGKYKDKTGRIIRQTPKKVYVQTTNKQVLVNKNIVTTNNNTNGDKNHIINK